MLKKMRRVAQFAGLDVRRFRDPWAALDRLPEVRTLVDVGVGDNGTPWLWKRFSGAKLLLVDPLRECRPDPMPPNASFVEAALGAEERNATINIAPRVSQSSLLERTALTHKGAPVEKREVRMRRLDDVVEGEPPFGLKIDTEGYELEVLTCADGHGACHGLIAVSGRDAHCGPQSLAFRYPACFRVPSARNATQSCSIHHA